MTPSASGLPWARILLGQAREELRAADAKATALFGIVGTAVSVVVGAAVALSWTPAELPLAPALCWWVAAVSAVGSIILSGAALYPRVRPARASGDKLLNFADVALSSDADAVRAQLDRVGADEYELLCGQLLAVSRIARTKYRLIVVSLWLLALTVAAAAAAAALDAGGV